MLPALRIGGTYRARVERLLPGGRVRISVSGQALTARAAAPMREGEELTVEVVRIVPELVLRVATGARQQGPHG